MYNSYFGFREKPFKLVPNPDYLFLSQSHEIALAHLTYATDQGDGFVVITGEVGTGKTTLCRNYLESLDEKTASAYIFNPRLESAQLLASICGEFGIQTEETRINVLLDLLNNYLIKQNAAGFKVVVLIDEAQGLSIENLELVRMLSNLETTRSKLLQIILVGQPELADQLDSYELRQLAQRISLHYHLCPLTAKESEAYIQHRLGIATQRRATLFTTNACRSAYHYSGGIPRLINIVCDRALLLAYSHNRPRVTRKIMQAAIRELLARGQARKSMRHWPYLIGGSALLFLAALALALFVWHSRPAGNLHQQQAGSYQNPIAGKDAGNLSSLNVVPAPETDKSIAGAVDRSPEDQTAVAANVADSVGTEPSQQSLSTIVPAEATLPGPVETQTTAAEMDSALNSPPDQARSAAGHMTLPALIERLDTRSSRKNAVHELLSLWDQPRPNVDLLPDQLKDPVFIDLAARQYGLRAYVSPLDWGLIEKIGFPAILTLKKKASGADVYLALVAKDGDHLRVSAGQDASAVDTDIESIEGYVTGPMYIFWKNTLGFDMLIGNGANENAVLGVQHLLRQIGYDQVPISSVFDRSTRAAVVAFQKKNNLDADGLVGPLTKIMLLREAGASDRPHLAN